MFWFFQYNCRHYMAFRRLYSRNSVLSEFTYNYTIWLLFYDLGKTKGIFDHVKHNLENQSDRFSQVQNTVKYLYSVGVLLVLYWMKLDNNHIYLLTYFFIYLYNLSHQYNDKVLLKFQVIFIECSKDHNMLQNHFLLSNLLDKLPQYDKISG